MIQTSAPFEAKNRRLVKQPVHLITIQDYERSFSNRPTNVEGQFPWITAIDDLTITVSDLDGGADLGQLVFHVQDREGLITADFPTFTFEGKKVILRTGFVGMRQADFATLFVGLITQIDSDNNNTEYIFTCSDIRQELTQVIYKVSDDGATPTDSSNPRTVNGHPLDILLAILQTEIGLDPTAIDVAGISNLRDLVYSGTQFLFKITSPPAAKDFIENELMKPLGAYLWPNSLGQICVKSFYPQLQLVPMQLNPKNILGTPIAEQTQLVNTISVRFDQDSDGKFFAESIQQYAPSTQKYGLFGQQIIESAGMRSGFQGFYLAGLTAFLIFLRYGMKSLLIGENNEFEALWTACILEPGDQVLLSHPKVPDRSQGIMGLSSRLMEVMDRTYHFKSATVQLKLLDLSSISLFQITRIAPSGEGAFTTVSPVDQGRYMFLTDDNDLYSNQVKGNPLA